MKTTKELRKFGLTMAVAFLIIGSLFLWRGKPVWPYLLGLSGFFLLSGLLLPRTLGPAEWAWMKLAHVLGTVMTTILLTLTFYLVITPLGIWLALKMIPSEVMVEARQKAKDTLAVPGSLGGWGTAIIVSTWAIALVATGYLVYRMIRK